MIFSLIFPWVFNQNHNFHNLSAATNKPNSKLYHPFLPCPLTPSLSVPLLKIILQTNFHIIDRYFNYSEFDFPAAMTAPKAYSTLNTTKSDTFRLVSPSCLLQSSIASISSKFSTSQSYYLTSTIDQAVQNKRCRLKWMMKDEEFNREEEILQKYCTLEQGEKQLPELTEYYKYYTQTSIIYQQNFFKLMHQHREKRKVVEYNRLKLLLNLSQTTENSELAEKERKNSTPVSSFYILSRLNTTLLEEENEESENLAKLRNKLEKSLGPNCYRTVQELDRNYHFQKKLVETVPNLEVKCFKKIKFSRQQKENLNSQLKNSKFRNNKRNNSCEVLNTPSKRMEVKQKTIKKKNFSMDNLTSLVKDYQIKEAKPKLFGNWMKNTDQKSVKGQQSRQKERISQQKLRSQQNERDYDIRSKILDTKERIRKEKLQLKKKTTMTTNQSQTIKSIKKMTTLQVSPKDKHRNRKLVKIAFF